MEFHNVSMAAFSGVLATLTMDSVAVALGLSGLIRLKGHAVVPALLGRWVIKVGQGAGLCSNLLAEPAYPGEVRTGWIAHYAIGSVLGILYAYYRGSQWSGGLSGWQTGGIYGLATCLLPWLLMYKAVGFGMFGARTPVQGMLLISSVLNHLVYGITLGLVYFKII